MSTNPKIEVTATGDRSLGITYTAQVDGLTFVHRQRPQNDLSAVIEVYAGSEAVTVYPNGRIQIGAYSRKAQDGDDALAATAQAFATAVRSKWEEVSETGRRLAPSVAIALGADSVRDDTFERARAAFRKYRGSAELAWEHEDADAWALIRKHGAQIRREAQR